MSVWIKLTKQQKNCLIDDRLDLLTDIMEGKISNRGLKEIHKKMTPGQLRMVGNKHFYQIDYTQLSPNQLSSFVKHLQQLDEHGGDYKAIILNKKFQVYEYNELTAPDYIKETKMWAVARRLGNICWYTGEECYISLGDVAWCLTEEHLIPDSRGGSRTDDNIVVAAYFVNNKLANAPLHVKLHIRSELIEIRNSVAHLSSQVKVGRYKEKINQVLEVYKVHGCLPWNTAPKTLEQTIDQAFEDHCKAEQEFIDKFLGNVHNIRQILEEMTDGLEAWQQHST